MRKLKNASTMSRGRRNCGHNVTKVAMQNAWALLSDVETTKIVIVIL